MSFRIAGLIGEIGRPSFPDALADLILSACSIAQCNVFQIGRENSIRCLFHWCRRQPAKASSYIVDRYLAGPVSVDPVLQRVREENCTKKIRSSSVFFLRSADIADKAYRETFFENRALGGKMSVYERAKRDGIYMNFYSARNRQQFTSFEIETLSWLSRIISMSLIRHHEIAAVRKSAPIPLQLDEITTLLGQGAPALTKRELDVCSRIVAGYTAEAIALDLGISYNSVATYRRRAYGRLAISSHHELFALCLDATLQHDTRR
jgi:DNA-binding CsgD family transcriptional regulator